MTSHATTRNVRVRAPRRLVALSKLAQLTSALAVLSLTSIRVSADTADRPAIAFNRWTEDWSVLADPNVPREPLDELKYIPLSNYDACTYLSFGANVRERFEVNDTNFGLLSVVMVEHRANHYWACAHIAQGRGGASS